MKFTKMHGLGNDYVFANCFEEHVNDGSALARAISDRHTGIGSDGLVLIAPSAQADVRMVMYNADGSRAEMCGNGIRCVAKFAVERGLVDGSTVRIETDAGIRLAECRRCDAKTSYVRVDMGRPSLAVGDVHAAIALDRIVDYPLKPSSSVDDSPGGMPGEFRVTCVSMGNPHAVAFVDDLDRVSLSVDGPWIERATEFPQRINVHFARVRSPQHVEVKTWERGSGATRACGTGACAVCVAGAVTGRTERRITATLPGGDLEIAWGDDDHVYMTGPAVEVFRGDWPV